MLRLDPITRRQLQRFRSLKRGYGSFVVLLRASADVRLRRAFEGGQPRLIVKCRGHYYFPTYTAFHPGTDFGGDYSYETNYRKLKEHFATEARGDWVLLPPFALQSL